MKNLLCILLNHQWDIITYNNCDKDGKVWSTECLKYWRCKRCHVCGYDVYNEQGGTYLQYKDRDKPGK